MLTLWKSSSLKYRAMSAKTGFCFSTFFREGTRNSSLLLNVISMGRKSKRKRDKILTSAINDRISSIRNSENQNVPTNLVQDTQKKVTPKKKVQSLSPWKTVVSFYEEYSIQQKIKFNLSPQYDNINNFIQCTLKLKYPIKVNIRSIGQSRKLALQSCSLEVLQVLKENNFINDKKLLTYNDFVDVTARYENQRKWGPTNLFRSAILDINKNNMIAQTSLTPKRNITTTSRYNLRSLTSEKPKPVQPNQSSSDKIVLTPKSTIHNYYNIISSQLNKDYGVTTSYTHLKHHHLPWACTYHVKWPEEIVFTKSGFSKKEAAGKVCVEILNYLQSLNLISSRGVPILKEEKINEKQQSKIISLKDDTVKQLNKINMIYQEKLLKSLPDYSINLDDSLNEERKELFPNQRRAQKKSFMHIIEEKTNLPISKYKNDIIEAVNNNQVTIIKGEPGCGKSTRVPQYLLEGWAKSQDQEHCKILVTQPRRIAAISLAERVSYERNEQVGKTVGYQVRLQNSFCPRLGKILYCTTGILLRKMQADPHLLDCSHVILDEAHERDVNTDLLMNLLRSGLEKNKNLKLVVMSATIDAGIFQEYFKSSPVFNIPGFTYPVKQHFINNANSLNFSKTLEMCESKIPHVVCPEVVKLIDYIHNNKGDGAILCFLPGWEEIKTIAELLEDRRDIRTLCLHSRLSMVEQKLIFSKPPRGMRKVILSTNIAETSVTVDDVVYVIDTGIQKETRFDITKGVTCLDKSWISQANVKQRKGRAGRCQPGESFHLYPKEKCEHFEEYPLPEILRTSLTKIVLDSKVYSNNMNAIEFMSQLISPPSDDAIKLAVKELIDLELLDIDENLTTLGRALANFQLEPKLAKTMVNAMVFKCVTPIIDIVTLFSEEKELFMGGLRCKETVKKIKKAFCSSSDHLSLMKMFEKWLEYIETDEINAAQRFCLRNNLVESKLHTLQQLRDIHFEYLEKYLKNVLPISDDLSDNDELIKGVLLSGVGTLMEYSSKVKGKKKKHVLLTRSGHNAVITTESVNSRRASYSSDYLIYINEVVSNVRRTSVIRETSLVSLLTLLLFKNNKIIIENLPQNEHSSDINSTDQVLLKLENTKYKYICDRSQAEAIQSCKEVLQSMLQYYIFQLTNSGVYNENVNKNWDEMLNILNSLLEDVKIS
ncbi:ATP-dependent DNA/RNA helicase DHX36-like [Onthophagus taurus]|uniref:ATP-dependent DNA/RNA helicase DHX36-like n=1 Tax=Onthophagus taurus TaxID=166361 RepID=UPI0039BE6B74